MTGKGLLASASGPQGKAAEFLLVAALRMGAFFSLEEKKLFLLGNT
jgi:hypothetical protein